VGIICQNSSHCLPYAGRAPFFESLCTRAGILASIVSLTYLEQAFYYEECQPKEELRRRIGRVACRIYPTLFVDRNELWSEALVPRDSDEAPMTATEKLEDQVYWYLQVLHDRGYSERDVARQEDGLEMLARYVLMTDVEEPCRRLRAFRKLLREVMIPEDDVEEYISTVRAFCQWLSEPVKPLTVERVAELAKLREQSGPSVPKARDIQAILGAPDTSTPLGLRDALIFEMVAYYGFSAKELCRSKVGSLVPRTGANREATKPDGRLRATIQKPLATALADFVRGRCADEPLFQTRSGEPLTPRRLQQRLKDYVSELGDALTEPLTLQDLRDYAVANMLDNGATWKDVAKTLGYSRTADVRRRYSGEAWEYLADREGNWFHLETAATVEGLDVLELQDWVAHGMPHEACEEQIFVRKQNIREVERLPALPHRLAEMLEGQPPPQLPEAVEDSVADLTAVLGNSNAEDGLAAIDRLAQRLGPRPCPLDADMMRKLTEVGKPIFLALRKLREKYPGAAAANQRVSDAIGEPYDEDSTEVPQDYGDLRALLVQGSSPLQTVDMALTLHDFDHPPGPALMYVGHILSTQAGVNAFDEVLSNVDTARIFWLLVDMYYDDLMRYLTTAQRYYWITKEPYREFGVGCLLYAFWVGIVLASPSVQIEASSSAQCQDDILSEVVRHWVFGLLNAAGAVAKDFQGNLLSSSGITHIPEAAEFMREFESRWRLAEKFRRSPWTFWVLPTVSVFDIVRYQHKLYEGHQKGDVAISHAASNHLLYLIKLPAERLVLDAHKPPTEPMKWIIYLMYMPMMNAEYKRTVEYTAARVGWATEDLAELSPPSLPEDVRNLVYQATEGFDFVRGTSASIPADSSTKPGGSSFSTYLAKAAKRYFIGLGRELQKKAQSASSEGYAEAIGEEDDVIGHEGALLTGGNRIPYVGPGEFPTIRGPDGDRYSTTYWTSRRGQVSQRWVQRHASELGGKRASEVFDDPATYAEIGLSADSWLIPADADLSGKIGASGAGKADD